MAKIQITLQKPYTKQQELINNKKRNNLLLLPRRYGKTTVSKILVAREAIKVPNYRAAWSAPVWKLMTETFEEFVELLEPITKRLSREDKRIQLINGSLLEFWSSQDPSAGRSRKYHRWVSDETQKQRSLQAFIKGSVRPSLADYRGDLWILGTPNGVGSAFHELYLECMSELSNWQVAHGSLNDNPYIHPDEIIQMRKELGPILSAQELDAQWVRIDGIAPLVSTIDWNNLYFISEAQRSMKVLALDASINSDTTGLVAGWRDLINHEYFIDYDDVHCIRPSTEDGQIDFMLLEELIWRLWLTGKYSLFVYDPYQCVSMAQRLRSRGVRTQEFTQNTQRLKADSFLRQVINDQQFHHPDHPDLNQHMLNATLKYGQGSSVRLVKPEKTKHIDLAVATSMAIYTLSTMTAQAANQYDPQSAVYNVVSIAASSPFGYLQNLKPTF